METVLSIFSQLLPQGSFGLVTAIVAPLSIFSQLLPEVLASWLLINLSTANFEVSENLPALPPDTCVGSRKPFPNSRRKEGIWRERNEV